MRVHRSEFLNSAVTAMPTFVFLRGSTKIDQVRGADKRYVSRIPPSRLP